LIESTLTPAMADLFYMSKKFGNAVHHMAVVDAPRRQRVRDAYVNSARLARTEGSGHANAQPSDELVRAMEELSERVTQDGAYDTTFSLMSDEEVGAIAEEIYEIYIAIQGELSGALWTAGLKDC